METVNLDPEVMMFVDTMLCGDISAPLTGQLALELMTNPPKPGDPSHDMYTQVKKQNLPFDAEASLTLWVL